MSLQEVSKKSNVSTSLLSQVERGKSVPTITTLEKICKKAFNLSVAEFLSDNESPSSDGSKGREESRSEQVFVVARDNRKKLILPRGQIHYELLSPDLQKKIEFIYVFVPVGAKTDSFMHNGEECGVILEGTLKGVIGENEITLREGDSIYFDSSIPHRWENGCEKVVKAIWAITPPSF